MERLEQAHPGMDIAQEIGGLEYESAIRYNFNKRELEILIEMISMVKSVVKLMSNAEDSFAPIIRFHIHHRIQQLVQGDLTPLMHRVDKREKNSSILTHLLHIRALAADWVGQEPREDYKLYSRHQGKVKAFHEARVVGPSPTQLHILRYQIKALCDERSVVRQRKGGLFTSGGMWLTLTLILTLTLTPTSTLT